MPAKMTSMLKVLILLIILPFSLHAEMSLWNKLLLSDKAYAKNIEVKIFVLTGDQSATLLANPSSDLEQLKGSEIAKFPVNYLVVQVRNLGKKHTWGTLACTVPGVWEPIKVPIISIGDHFCNYIISLDGIAVAFSHDSYAPKLTYKWDQLYTK